MTINIVPSMNELLINYIHYPGDLLKTTNLFKTKKVKSAINFWFEFHSILLYTTNNKKKESHANSWSSWIIIKWSDVKCYTDFYVIFHFKKLYCWSADQVFFWKVIPKQQRSWLSAFLQVKPVIKRKLTRRSEFAVAFIVYVYLVFWLLCIQINSQVKQVIKNWEDTELPKLSHLIIHP